MAQNDINSLSLEALDDCNAIRSYLELLTIALEQSDLDPRKVNNRVNLLLNVYLQNIEPCFERIELNLEEIRKLSVCAIATAKN